MTPSDPDIHSEPFPVESCPNLCRMETAKGTHAKSKVVELEQVMTSGMQFLAELFKMSTRKDLELGGQKMSVNKETGEVTMTFKLPVS